MNWHLLQHFRLRGLMLRFYGDRDHDRVSLVQLPPSLRCCVLNYSLHYKILCQLRLMKRLINHIDSMLDLELNIFLFFRNPLMSVRVAEAAED